MRKRKTYSKEFKEEAIRLVKENGETFAKHTLSPDSGVRLKFQSSKY